MSLRPILFNLTRLISRRASKTATGIDRVELHHARLVATQAQERPVMYLQQAWNTMRPVSFEDATHLIEQLSACWRNGNESKGSSFSPKLASARRMVDGWVGERLNKSLHAEIQRFLINRPRPIFINSGQLGANHMKIHQYLGEQHDTDLVFYLHDLIPIDYPEYLVNPKGHEFHRRRIITMARTGRIVLANSNYTAHRFKRFCDEEGLTTPETEILNIGVESCILEATKAPRPVSSLSIVDIGNEPYFVVLGTIEPRKNHLLLLQLWRRMARQFGKSCPKLLILGRRGWKNENVIDLLERSSVLKGCVYELNDVADVDMVTLVQHAQALLFPSFEEGWGMPLVEALALGTPAVCSDIPAFRESGQGRAFYVDPLDGMAWMKAIRALAGLSRTHGETFRQDLKVRTEGFTPPTWEEHSVGLERVIKRLDESKFTR